MKCSVSRVEHAVVSKEGAAWPSGGYVGIRRRIYKSASRSMPGLVEGFHKQKVDPDLL